MVRQGKARQREVQFLQLCKQQLFPSVFNASQIKKAVKQVMVVPALKPVTNLRLSGIPRMQTAFQVSLSRRGRASQGQSATRCLEGRPNLERQSAAFCGQGAEAHWSASLPSRQLSVQDILVQCLGIQLRARAVLVKKMALTVQM